jgi:hypothetical protein
MFNGEVDCVAAKLRPGNVHSAEDWEELLLPGFSYGWKGRRYTVLGCRRHWGTKEDVQRGASGGHSA